ncbi:MAG: DUF5777 family beta-barrel protein [Bacteroidota bacterium]|nr:hypothetical protein [Odoribacter sp.]MDP3645190.1 DUF5777 family beta-barrel protein [Bacteroidota bacterium]
MKKNIIFLVLLSFISVVSFAQQDAAGVKEKDYPVSATFESGSLIDAQTVVIPEVKTLEMVVQHKFGTIEDGRSNLWGIYGSANIRLGLNYVLAKNFQIGAGITKKGMMGEKSIIDLNAKWALLKQTRQNSIPVSVALYGNIAANGIAASEFDQVKIRMSSDYSTVSFLPEDRLSYFSQLIVGRKFNEWLSLQSGVSFTHYNLVKSIYDHDKVGVHFNGRIKVSPQGSIVFTYDHPLKIKEISEQWEWTDHPKPSVSFGYEVSTGTHAFQIYMGSTTSLLPQDNIMWNQNKMDKSGFAIGFVITRLWAF